MTNTFLSDSPLEVVKEDFLELLLGVDGVWTEAF